MRDGWRRKNRGRYTSLGLFDINHPWLVMIAKSGKSDREIFLISGVTSALRTSPLFVFLIMSTNVPWIPSLYGSPLQALNRLAPLLENGDLPSTKNDSKWLRSVVRRYAIPHPDAEPSLWETVLNLWRLGQVESCEEDDGEDSLWADHVKAWLVRRDVSSKGDAD